MSAHGAPTSVPAKDPNPALVISEKLGNRSTPDALPIWSAANTRSSVSLGKSVPESKHIATQVCQVSPRNQPAGPDLNCQRFGLQDLKG